MATKFTTDADLLSIANAIRTKGGTSEGLEYPSGFVSAIQNIPTGGGGGSTDGDVIFIDYDGTIVATKTTAEINNMTSDSDLPAFPSHTGLIAQGWNWSVAQLKAQLTAMPDQKVYVGQMYITESGKTEIDVEMQEGRLSPILTICVNGEISVDWGDETTPNTVTGTSETSRVAVSHSYASAGNYTISIGVVNGSFSFYGSSNYVLLRKNTKEDDNKVYSNCIKQIRIGNGISNIRTYAFYNCYSLVSITIPSGVTSISNNVFRNCYSLARITIPSGVTSISSNAFYNCYSLVSIIIPSGVTSIGSNAFYNCYSLVSITIPSGVTSIDTNTFGSCYSIASIIIPSGVTSIGNSAFQNCYSIASITIPNGVTSIGSNAFQCCYSLASITIPSSVTSIRSNAFYNCSSLASITIPSGVTSISSSAFQYCYSLASITIPNSVTSIGDSAFYGCYSLASITIPSSVTSISSSAFSICYSLARITIPSGVTSIGGSAFYGCNGISEYHILPTAVPTGGTTMFYNIVSDCIIYVPQGKLSAYQSATNWSTYASYMQEES